MVVLVIRCLVVWLFFDCVLNDFKIAAIVLLAPLLAFFCPLFLFILKATFFTLIEFVVAFFENFNHRVLFAVITITDDLSRCKINGDKHQDHYYCNKIEAILECKDNTAKTNTKKGEERS